MTTTLIIAGVVGAVLGGALGHWKLKSPFGGGLFGAAVCVLLAFLLLKPPQRVVAVEDIGDFEKTVLQAGQPVFVDFTSERCPACRELAPVVDDLAEDYEGKVRFVKVDVEKASSLAQLFAIRYIPTVILFVRGQPVERWVGCKFPGTYRTALDDALTGELTARP